MKARAGSVRCAIAAMAAFAFTVASALLFESSTAYARIAALGPAVQANTTFVQEDSRSQWYERADALAMPDGGFVVLWDGRGRRFDAAGNPQGAEFVLQGLMAGIAAVAATTNGTLLVSSYEAFSNRWFVDRFTDHGTAVGSQVNLNDLFCGPGNLCVNDATVAATPSGGFVATVQADDDLGGFIDGQRLHENNQPVGATFEVARANGGFVGAVTSVPGGGFITSWWDEGSAVEGFSLRARQFDAQDNALADPFAVVEPGQVAELVEGPQVCVDASGDFVVAWHDENHPIEFR